MQVMRALMFFFFCVFSSFVFFSLAVVQLLQLLHFGLANALQTNVHILCARSIGFFVFDT